MMLRGADAPALGIEERDEAPRAGGAVAPRRPTGMVVATPTRRRFSANTGCGSSTKPTVAPSPARSAVLRREGLYSSDLSVWRKARRNGCAQGPDTDLSEKRGAKPENPIPERQSARSEALVRLELATAHDHRRAGKSCRALLGLNTQLERRRTWPPRHWPRRSAWRRRAGRWAWPEPPRKRILPSPKARSRDPGSPAKTPARHWIAPIARAVLDVVSLISTAPRARSSPPPVPVLGTQHVPPPGRRTAGPRTTQSTQPVRTTPNPNSSPRRRMSWDITRSARTEALDVLLPLRTALRSIRRRLDGRRTGECRARRPPHRGKLPDAGLAPGAHPALGRGSPIFAKCTAQLLAEAPSQR